jgi:hypothetical protein
MQRRKMEKKKVSPPVLISRHCAGTSPHSVPPVPPEIEAAPRPCPINDGQSASAMEALAPAECGGQSGG